MNLSKFKKFLCGADGMLSSDTKGLGVVVSIVIIAALVATVLVMVGMVLTFEPVEIKNLATPK